jgi:hypothetical protein
MLRNEKLLSNQETLPTQLAIRTNALLQSPHLQVENPSATTAVIFPLELAYAGPKIFVDATWKNTPHRQTSNGAIRIYMPW